MRGQVIPLLLFIAAGTAHAQPANLTGGPATVQPAEHDFARQVRGLASDSGVRWIGWAAPAAGDHQMCCWNSAGDWDDGSRCCGRCRLEHGAAGSRERHDEGSEGRIRLEAPSEIRVFVRLESGVRKIRVFSADCAIDAGGARVVWITGVAPEASVSWLESLAAAARPGAGDDNDLNVSSSAVAAIAHHAGGQADLSLERLAGRDRPRSVRRNAAFWLGNARGRTGYEALRRVALDDPDKDFRKHATFAFSQSREPDAVTTLISMAKHDSSAHVRGQALFWLAQKAGKKAAGAIEDAIRDDPDTEVKTKAVFALTQMPDGEGVPQLIQVARTNRNAEVRKKAVFWLGQSKDPRALAFFEEILTK